jgi:hypothetical protein
MEWIIETYDRRTDRDGENRVTTENAFISAADELLGNIWKGFVSATLPDGRVLDEAAMRALVAKTSVRATRTGLKPRLAPRSQASPQLRPRAVAA